MNIVVDTNVLLRILLEDPQQPQQVQAARQLAKKAEKLYVPQVVQVESAWMMERGYQLDKSIMLKLLTHLQSNEHFVLQEAEIFRDALQQYSLSNVGFADCIILAQAKKWGLMLYTFDKRLTKLAGASVVPLTLTDDHGNQ